MKIYIFIIVILLVSCGEDKKDNNGYKKQSDIPSTVQSIDKKSSPGNKITDYY